ncbi:MAG: class I SAM-dependent methyltransferase [Anaerolinea sp.]|nr:class I SAM-dependent methyltransferase [Anaerolinea sp.]
MFTKSAQFYDAIYSYKDYRGEVERIISLIAQHKTSKGDRLLDAACGTGGHLQFLRKHYSVEGFDLDADLLEIAHRRMPDVLLHLTDMTQMSLGKEYDIITCLFSSIGYVETFDRMRLAAANFRRHLVRGGVLLVEPWFRPDQWHTGTLHARFVDEPDLKISRMSISRSEGQVSITRFHYMVGTLNEIVTFTEDHRLGLFTDAQYRAAFEEAGFRVLYDAEGLTGRGLYIGEVVE